MPGGVPLAPVQGPGPPPGTHRAPPGRLGTGSSPQRPRGASQHARRRRKHCCPRRAQLDKREVAAPPVTADGVRDGAFKHTERNRWGSLIL